MLPLFAYFALSLAWVSLPHAAAADPKARPVVDLRYSRPTMAPTASHRGSMLSAHALQETSGIIDLKEAAFGVFDRSAPAIARYARGPVVVLPLFAPTVERDTAYGAAVSLRMP
jgi:hypothetical protein